MARLAASVVNHGADVLDHWALPAASDAQSEIRRNDGDLQAGFKGKRGKES
jgi:hypothetical protein